MDEISLMCYGIILVALLLVFIIVLFDVRNSYEKKYLLKHRISRLDKIQIIKFFSMFLGLTLFLSGSGHLRVFDCFSLSIIITILLIINVILGPKSESETKMLDKESKLIERDAKIDKVLNRRFW